LALSMVRLVFDCRIGLQLNSLQCDKIETTRIALALVVFASWRPARLVGGAYLFGAMTFLQLSVQALALGIPPQLMSSLPYLATVVVLVLISRTRGTAGSAAPASLGVVFVPDR
jgi:ABC-type uncharacterized transport system permease subunit